MLLWLPCLKSYSYTLHVQHCNLTVEQSPLVFQNRLVRLCKIKSIRLAMATRLAIATLIFDEEHPLLLLSSQCFKYDDIPHS